jgi:hypothetical protein
VEDPLALPEYYRHVDEALAVASASLIGPGQGEPTSMVGPGREERAAFVIGVRMCACHLVDDLYRDALASSVWLTRMLLRTHGLAMRLHGRDVLFTGTRGLVTDIAERVAAVTERRRERARITPPTYHSAVTMNRHAIARQNAGARYDSERQQARALAIRLAERYDKAGLDATGFDFSESSLRSPEWLQGIVWDDTTRWADGVREKVRGWSKPLGDGRWQVVHRWPRSVP